MQQLPNPVLPNPAKVQQNLHHLTATIDLAFLIHCLSCGFSADGRDDRYVHIEQPLVYCQLVSVDFRKKVVPLCVDASFRVVGDHT